MKPSRNAATAKNAPCHGEELEPSPLHRRKDPLQRDKVFSGQGLFIRRALLARVRKRVSGQVEQWIFAPRFAEHGAAARPDHATKLAGGAGEIQMMKNRVAPDTI